MTDEEFNPHLVASIAADITLTDEERRMGLTPEKMALAVLRLRARPDLVAKLDEIVADRYGEARPDTATGGSGAGRTYTVHYRRKDGTEATGQMHPDGHGGLVWHAPEDCAAITEVEYPPARGGAGSGHLPIPDDCAGWPVVRICQQEARQDG